MVFDNSPVLWIGIILVLFTKVLAGTFAFPVCAILITQQVPSRELLGTVNGANQALGSLSRAIGPAIAGYIYTKSLEVSKPWIVWRLVLGIFAILVCLGGWFLTDDVRRPYAKGYVPIDNTDDEESLDEEIEDEEERLWREEEDGTIDVDGMIPTLKDLMYARAEVGNIMGQANDELEGRNHGSSEAEMAQGMSAHLLSTKNWA